MTDPSWAARFRREIALCSDAFEAALETDDPRASEQMLYQAAIRLTWSPTPASGESVGRLSEVYGRIVGSGAKGRQTAEEGILTSLVLGADESLVGFFSGLFDITIERDRFSALRKVFAAAGLGVLVRLKGSHAALKALLQAAAHDNGDAAVAAVRALFKIYDPGYSHHFLKTTIRRNIGVAPPAEVITCLLECANHKGSFLARFHARRALQFLAGDAPLDNPQGAYQFRMSVENVPGFSVQFLVPSSAGLDSVLWLSLEALGWDYDHMHSFFLSGKKYDTVNEYPSDQENGSPLEPGINVGQVGFAPGVKFICLYDFGDSNVFKYTCQKVIPVLVGPQQGSIIKRTGLAPEQYPSW